ncbi:MAG: nodulation protein NfeD, partial [Firmicutes bacterium]|nr:nodulation protein NfeD [Bacillota bacterium]
VYAYINQRALSAGSFLALSTDGFFMAPGSTIGAAEPRYMGGSSVADPKFLSAWEARMRGAAERQGKDPLLAAAMVNKELEVEGVVEKGELLTLTSGEAERLAFVDGIVSDKDELCSLIGMPAARIISFTPSAAERITGFVTNPAVATLLLALGITAMVIEILTAGFGVAGLLSILCFSLYFGGHFMAGIAGWEAILLFLLGLALLLVEGFIPGFGIFGLGGLLALAASIVLAAVTAAQGVKMLLLSLLLSAVLIFFAFRFLQKKGLLRKFILQEAAKKELGYVATANREELVGLQGKTITPLRPAGKALIGGEQVDVVSEGGFIPANSKIYVQKVEGMRVVVRSQEESN